MIILLMSLLIVASLGLGFAIGRDYTKWECGKMLEAMRKAGFLTLPFGDDTDDEEDYK